MATSVFNKIQSPALPEWTGQYEQHFGSNYNRILRLYFNQLTNTLSTLGPYGSHGSFFSTTSFTNPVANTANLLTFTDTVRASNIRYTGAKVYVDNDGIYDIQFSVQLSKSSGVAAPVYFWYRINGTNVANSARKVVVNGVNAEVVPSWGYTTALNAGDYFELAWSSADTAVIITPIAAAAPVPAVPSVILTTSYQSPLQRA